MIALFDRVWPYALAVALVFAALYGAYSHGVNVTKNEWKAAVADQQLLQAKDLVTKTAAARTTEQGWQTKTNQVGKDARAQSVAAVADGVAADAAGNGVRDAANKLAASVGNVSCDTGAAERSASATRAAMVLSDMLQRADKRAGELAKFADESRIAGLACAAAHDVLLAKFAKVP